MFNLWHDLRYGARLIYRNPGFTLTAVLTLAIGVAASSTIFGVVNAFLFRPSAGCPEPDRIVRLLQHQTALNQSAAASAADLADYAQSTPAFERVAAFRREAAIITGGGEPESVSAIAISPGLLDIVGARVALGREFAAGEHDPGRDRVVLIGHGFWIRRLGGTNDVVGRNITLNRENYVTVGVLSPRSGLRGVAGVEPDIVTPFRPDAREDRAKRNLMCIARLCAGATLEQARIQLAAVSIRLEKDHPSTNENWRAVARGLRELDLQGDGKMFIFLLVGAALLLTVVCANVTNLLLANGAVRLREIATRVALGASRGRIVRQLLTEVLLIVVGGCVLGIILAFVARSALAAVVAGTNIGGLDLEVDERVLLFAAGVSVASGLAAGLFPAIRMSWISPFEGLKQGGTLTSGHAARLGALLVSGQMALSMTVMAGAGILLEGGWQVLQNDPGFRAERLLTLRISEPASGARAWSDMLEKLRSVPGVEAAGMTSLLPLSGGMPRSVSFYIAGRPRPEAGQVPTAGLLMITDGYFQTLGVPVKAGRFFDEREAVASLPVAVINESLARKCWPGESPVHAQIEIQGTLHTVLGVAGDIRTFHLVGSPAPEIYLPAMQSAGSGLALAVRTKSSDPFSVADAVKNEIHAVDSGVPVWNLHSMTQVIHGSMGGWRFMICLVSGLAVFSLGLAAVGLYALMSFIVSTRTHEIGLRMALGASTRDIGRHIVRQGFILMVWGAMPGCLTSWAVLRLVSAALAGISKGSNYILVILAVMLASVAVLASWLPAQRAAHVDPCSALRGE